MLKRGKEDICHGMEGMKYEHYKEIRGRLYERLLGTILERCIQERNAVLGPMKHARRPVLRLAQVKGLQMTMPSTNKE
jgi:hypothetical protein